MMDENVRKREIDASRSLNTAAAATERYSADVANSNTSRTHQKYNPHNWLIFLSERAPPVVFLLLAAGPCLTGLRFVQGYVDWEKFLWAIVSQLVLLLVIRVMDDVKDYELDKIVHSDRPLPRGLVQYDEVVSVINYSLGAMFVYAGLLALRFSWTIGIIYAIQVFYAVLMYIEFGVGEWFANWIFLYALSHQVSIYFGSWFICSLAGANWYGSVSFLLGSIAFSGFFTYEVCRKLDPTLPKLKGTYLIVYGKWLTLLITSFTVLVGVVSAYFLQLHCILWPLQASMLISLLILFLIPVKTGQKPRAHKPVEALALFYLLAHMWSGFFSSFWL